MKREIVTVYEAGDQIYTMAPSGQAFVWTVDEHGRPQPTEGEH